MAGTRLLVHSSFLFNLLILLGTTFLVLITQQHDGDSVNKNWWFYYYRGGSNFPTENFFSMNRNGIPLLNKLRQDVDCFKGGDGDVCGERNFNVKELKREVHTITFQLSSEEEHDITVLQSLATALEDGFNSIHPKSPNVKGGKDAKIARVLTTTSTDIEEVYSVKILYDDAKNGGASIQIDAKGAISITIRHNNSSDIIPYTKQLLQTKVAQLIYDEMMTIMLPSPSSPVVMPSACNTLVTIIDEDPSSFATTTESISAKEHHLLLNKMVAKVLGNILHPLFQTLSPLCPSSASPSLSTSAVLYGSLSDDSILVNRSSSLYHSMPATKLKTFWKEHSYSIFSSSSPSFINGMEGQQQLPQDQHHLILYVPTKSKMPLYYHSKKQEKGFISAFEIKNDKDAVLSSHHIGTVSIVNLQQDMNDASLKIEEEMYYKQMVDATSFLISHIRYTFGLHRLQPWLRDASKDGMVSLRHISPSLSSLEQIGDSNGNIFVTNWEIDMLLRQHWFITFDRAVQELEMLMHLMVDVNEIPCTMEMAQEIQKAIILLQQALSTAASQDGNKNKRQWRESTIYIHQALDICGELKTNADMIEPIHFLPEYLLAVFAPLLLPLFMPLVLGLIREIKRYKKLNAGEEWDVDSDDDDEKDIGDNHNCDDKNGDKEGNK